MAANAQQLSLLTSKLASVLKPGQKFVSPCSIHLAMALVAAGATGQTLAELAAVLDWPTGPGWQQQLAQLLSSLSTATGAGEPTVAVANRVFTKIPIQAQYAAAVQSTFGASIEPLQSAAQVNAFVSAATQRMITEIVNDAMVAQSPLIAVNALYFKGKWEVQLSKADTALAPFRTRDMPGTASRVESCHLMRTPPGKEWRYFEDANAQYVLMPYQGAGGAIAAVVALPKDVASDPLQLADFGAALAALRAAPKRKGAVWMPRFAVESEVELSSELTALGAPRAFSDAAEFGGVAAGGVPLKISKVLHKVKVEVDEEGTVAAAATAVCMAFGGGMSSGPPPFQMRCDRPFAFAVAHVPSGLVLFAGSVESPGCVGDAPPPGAVSPGGAVPFGQPSPFGPPAPANPFAPAPASAFPPAPATALFPHAAAPAPAVSFSLDQRREQACLFTAACRRDVYRILCAAPRGPLRAPPPPTAPASGGFGFGAADRAAPPRAATPPLRWVFDSSGGGGSTFGFGGGGGGGRPQLVPAGARTPVADVARTLAAIETVGQPTAEGVAFTEALEALLVREYVGWWDDADAATLSAAFLAAFGNELTPRLDLEHALRSRALPHDDLAWLRALPVAIAFNRGLIDTFQG